MKVSYLTGEEGAEMRPINIKFYSRFGGQVKGKFGTANEEA